MCISSLLAPQPRYPQAVADSKRRVSLRLVFQKCAHAFALARRAFQGLLCSAVHLRLNMH